ncbi:unnamed protein product [Mortierella alpina]
MSTFRLLPLRLEHSTSPLYLIVGDRSAKAETDPNPRPRVPASQGPRIEPLRRPSVMTRIRRQLSEVVSKSKIKNIPSTTSDSTSSNASSAIHRAATFPAQGYRNQTTSLHESGATQSFKIAPRCLTSRSHNIAGVGSNDSQIHKITTYGDRETGGLFVLWKDITDVFENAQFVIDASEGQVVPLMVSDQYNGLEPKRIAYHPDIILDVFMSPLATLPVSPRLSKTLPGEILVQVQREEQQVKKLESGSEAPYASVHRDRLQSDESYYPKVLDTPNILLTKMNEIADYNKLLQSVDPHWHMHIHGRSSYLKRLAMFRGELDNGENCLQVLAHVLSGRRGLEHLAIRVMHVPIIQDEHVHEQYHTVLTGLLAEPSILAPFMEIFLWRTLETLTIARPTSIMEDAPSDISLPSLRFLNLSGMTCETARGINTLKSLIRSCDLKSLAIVNTQQISDGLARVIDDCARAKHLQHLQVLDLSNNSLSREDMNKMFGGILSFCSKIDSLTLHGNMGLDVQSIPRMSSRSNLSCLEVSDVSFESIECLVKAASVAGSFPVLRIIVVRRVTSEAPMKREFFVSFCTALEEETVLDKLVIISEYPFRRLGHHALEFDFKRRRPSEHFSKDAKSWTERVGSVWDENKRDGSHPKFYLAGASDFERFHPGNHISLEIPQLAPRILELAPATDELTDMISIAPTISTMAPSTIFSLQSRCSHSTMAGHHRPANHDTWGGQDNIWQCARKGNLALVKYHLDKEPSLINTPWEFDGRSVLSSACASSHPQELVEFLVQRGALVNSADTFHKRTALHVLCEEAGLSQDDWRSVVPQIEKEASERDVLAAMRFMLDHGAVVDAKNHWKETAMMRLLAGRDCPLMVQELYSRGADSRLKSSKDVYPHGTALAYAAFFGRINSLRWMVHNDLFLNDEASIKDAIRWSKSSMGEPYSSSSFEGPQASMNQRVSFVRGKEERKQEAIRILESWVGESSQAPSSSEDSTEQVDNTSFVSSSEAGSDGNALAAVFENLSVSRRCEGFTVNNPRRCGASGNYRSGGDGTDKYYCFQHCPEHKPFQCVGRTTKEGRPRCAIRCSDNERAKGSPFFCKFHSYQRGKPELWAHNIELVFQ